MLVAVIFWGTEQYGGALPMNRFSTDWAIGKRQFESLTGVTLDQFWSMVGQLRPHWNQKIVEPKNRVRVDHSIAKILPLSDKIRNPKAGRGITFAIVAGALGAGFEPDQNRRDCIS
jgi:hypothetical protein